MKRSLLKKAFYDTLPVMSGYMVLGIGFGIMLEEAGYGFLWALLMSGAIFAGSMQYVGISLLASVATIPTVILTTLLVNARHLFYGVSMIDKYKGAGIKKPYMIFALTDETYSLVCCDKFDNKQDMHTYSFYVSLLDQLYWVAGSVLGSVIGSAIPFSMAGIEFSMTALFVTVFVDQWIGAKNHIPALTGLLSSVLCLLIFGSGNFLIPSMALITIILAFMKGRCSEDE